MVSIKVSTNGSTVNVDAVYDAQALRWTVTDGRGHLGAGVDLNAAVTALNGVYVTAQQNFVTAAAQVVGGPALMAARPGILGRRVRKLKGPLSMILLMAAAGAMMFGHQLLAAVHLMGRR